MICCNNAFEQGNLDLWRYINAFIIIIIYIYIYMIIYIYIIYIYAQIHFRESLQAMTLTYFNGDGVIIHSFIKADNPVMYMVMPTMDSLPSRPIYTTDIYYARPTTLTCCHGDKL